MAALLTQYREESLAPGVRPLDDDHAVLAEPPFLFTTGGIEVAVEFLKLSEDLRIAVPVISQLRALDLQELAEGFVGMRRVRNVEDRIRVHRVLEIRLPPCVAEPLGRAEPVERDVKRRNLQLMVQCPDGMLVEGLGGQGGISILQRVIDALRGEAVDICDAAPIMAGIKVRCPVQKPVPMQDR